jgi:hypothetical protein
MPANATDEVGFNSIKGDAWSSWTHGQFPGPSNVLLISSISPEIARHHTQKISKGFREPDSCIPLDMRTAKPPGGESGEP